jgi:hypothetical protein
MPKKPAAPPTIAALQRVIAEPITDPAELAAFEAFRKRLKRKKGGLKAQTIRNGRSAATNPAAKKAGKEICE